MTVAMGFTKGLLPSIKRLFMFQKTHFFPKCKIKPIMIFSQSISQTSSHYNIRPSKTLEKTFLTNRVGNIYYSRQNQFQRNTLLKSVCKSNISLFQSTFKLLPECSSNSMRCFHARTKLSVEDDLYASFLQSLVEELRVSEEEQSNNTQSFRKESEEKLYVSRYQFLVSTTEVISRILGKQSEISELESLFADEKDVDMKEMMQNEISTIKTDILQLEDELIDVLAGDEPADNNDIILEVSAGVGGQEAMLFCAEVFNMYCQYGQNKGWNVALVDKDENELGGHRKASIEISGSEVYKGLKYESGVHRVQRVPKTEKAGRIHTSTVTVSILPQPREIDIQIEKKDLKIETFRGSGPGGQSVNTTDSAVRITHLPTGTVAECKQERSQIKNKDIAMKALKSRIYQAQLEVEAANRQATRKMQIGSRGRSEKIRTYNFQQDRVTDHRVKENCNNLHDFLGVGEGLDDLIESLERDYKYRVVESMVDEYELSLKRSNKKV